MDRHQVIAEKGSFSGIAQQNTIQNIACAESSFVDAVFQGKWSILGVPDDSWRWKLMINGQKFDKVENEEN